MDTIKIVAILLESGIGVMLALPGILIGLVGVMLVFSSVLDFDLVGLIVGLIFVGLGLGWINWTLGNIRGFRRIGAYP
jgi:hypothetical protein